jgi:predicted transcriptional regulator
MLLISLHPRHSKNVFSGKKAIELRKVKPRMNGKQLAFNKVLIYETMPTAKIVGWCDVIGVIYGNADFMIDYANDLCLSPDEIKTYLGNKIGYGLLLKQPILINPIPLTAMRNCGILPPQGMVYLKSETVKKLMFPV